MILVVDRQYRYVIVNRAYLNFRGVTAEQVLGLTTEEVVGREAFEGIVKEQMDKCFSGEVVHYEMTYNFATVGEKNMSISYFPSTVLRASTASPACCRTSRNASERRWLYFDRKKDSARRFATTAGDHDLDRAEGRYLDANEALLQLLGYERREVIGHTSAELHFWAELRIARKYCRNSTRRKTWCGAIRDTGPRKEKFEKQKLGWNRSNWRTSLLLGITRMSQRCSNWKPSSASPEDGSRWALAGAWRTISIIYWDYSGLQRHFAGVGGPGQCDKPALVRNQESHKTRSGAYSATPGIQPKQVVFPKILDLNDVVNKTTTMFLRLVGEDIEIEFRPTVRWAASSDPGQIEQVLMNLVVNARDAMPPEAKSSSRPQSGTGRGIRFPALRLQSRTVFCPGGKRYRLRHG